MPHRNFCGQRHACIGVAEFLVGHPCCVREDVPADARSDAHIHEVADDADGYRFGSDSGASRSISRVLRSRGDTIEIAHPFLRSSALEEIENGNHARSPRRTQVCE